MAVTSLTSWEVEWWCSILHSPNWSLSEEEGGGVVCMWYGVCVTPLFFHTYKLPCSFLFLGHYYWCSFLHLLFDDMCIDQWPTYYLVFFVWQPCILLREEVLMKNDDACLYNLMCWNCYWPLMMVLRSNNSIDNNHLHFLFKLKMGHVLFSSLNDQWVLMMMSIVVLCCGNHSDPFYSYHTSLCCMGKWYDTVEAIGKAVLLLLTWYEIVSVWRKAIIILH